MIGNLAMQNVFVMIALVSSFSCCNSFRTAQLAKGGDSISTLVVKDLVLFTTSHNGHHDSDISIYNITSNSMSYANLSVIPLQLYTTVHKDLVFFSSLDVYKRNIIDVYNSTSNSWHVFFTPTYHYYVEPISVQDCVLFLVLNATNKPTSLIDIYNSTSNTWKTTNYSEPLPNSQISVVQSAVMFTGQLYCCPGDNRLIVYSLTSEKWTNSSIISSLNSPMEIVIQNELISFLYYYYDTSHYPVINQSSVLHSYNVSSSQWNILFINSTIFNNINSIVSYNDALIMETQYPNNQIITFDLEGNNYTTTNISYFCQLTNLNGTLLCDYSGYGIELYNETLDAWFNVPLPNSISGYSARILVGDSILVRGQDIYTGYFKEALVYNITSGLWSSIPLNLTTTASFGITLSNTGIMYGGSLLSGNYVIGYSTSVFAFTPCFRDTDCDDNIFCNGQEFCDTSSFCSSGSLPCANQSLCNSVCNEIERNCFAIRGDSCDNEIYCDGVDTCDGSGNCVHSGNPCNNLTECKNECVESEYLCSFSSYGTNCTGSDPCSIFICDGYGSCKPIAIYSPSCDSLKIITKSKTNSSNVGIIVGSILGALSLLLLIGVLLLLVRKRRKQLVGEVSEYQNNIEMSLYVIDNIKKLEKLGSGEFGDVYRGFMDESIQVALKSLKNSEYNGEFQREISLMSTLNHPNVVRLYGLHISTDSERYMVFEFMSKGSLLSLLHKEGRSINSKSLHHMTKQVLAGMKYLESNHIVHRDLALRNILVTIDEKGDYLVKVSDFGMSRSAEKGYYKTNDKKMPIKWSAPEFIQYGTSTSKSDVWSFGICLWEIFSYGAVPYIGWSNDVVVERVLSGYRIPPPANCPNSLYDLMYDCWNVEPSKRPTFTELNQRILSISIDTTLPSDINGQDAFTVAINQGSSMYN